MILIAKIRMELNWQKNRDEKSIEGNVNTSCQKLHKRIDPLYRRRGIVHWDSALPFPVSFNFSTIRPGECVATKWIDKFNWNCASPDHSFMKMHLNFAHHFSHCDIFANRWICAQWNRKIMMTHPLITDFGAPACVRSNNDLTWLQRRPPQHWINFFRFGFGVWKWCLRPMTSTRTTISQIYGFSPCEKWSMEIKETIRFQRINAWRRRIVAAISIKSNDV